MAGALAEYERLITPQASARWTSVLEPRFVLARSRLARRAGDSDAAGSEYRRFRGLWQGADAELRETAEARAQARSVVGPR